MYIYYGTGKIKLNLLLWVSYVSNCHAYIIYIIHYIHYIHTYIYSFYIYIYIHYSLFLHVVKQNYLSFFLIGFSFTNIMIHRTAGKGWVTLYTFHHFHLLHKHLDISQVVAAKSTPLHIAGSRTRTGNLWFPSVSR